MADQRFSIRVDDRFRLLLRLFAGATRDRAWATIGETEVAARLGWWEIRVPISNITRWRIEGPWNWITAVGVRRSVRGGDLSFSGSPRGGVRMDFAEPVKWTIFRVPALYLGVEDLEGFAAALTTRGIEGEDARDH